MSTLTEVIILLMEQSLCKYIVYTVRETSTQLRLKKSVGWCRNVFPTENADKQKQLFWHVFYVLYSLHLPLLKLVSTCKVVFFWIASLKYCNNIKLILFLIRARTGVEKVHRVIEFSPGLNSGQVKRSSLAAPIQSSSWVGPEAKSQLKYVYNKL